MAAISSNTIHAKIIPAIYRSEFVMVPVAFLSIVNLSLTIFGHSIRQKILEYSLMVLIYIPPAPDVRCIYIDNIGDSLSQNLVDIRWTCLHVN